MILIRVYIARLCLRASICIALLADYVAWLAAHPTRRAAKQEG